MLIKVLISLGDQVLCHQEVDTVFGLKIEFECGLGHNLLSVSLRLDVAELTLLVLAEIRR